MHTIPLKILKRQAESIGIPLYTVASSTALKNYNQKMSEAVQHFKELGMKHFIFGDIFLSDVKAYRESKLHPLGIKVVEPLWEKTLRKLLTIFRLQVFNQRLLVRKLIY